MGLIKSESSRFTPPKSQNPGRRGCILSVFRGRLAAPYQPASQDCKHHMRIPHASLYACLGLGLAVSATFARAEAPEVELVKKLGKGAVEVIKTFPAPEIGLTGVVVKQGGKTITVFVDPAGKFMFSGMFMDADGKNLSAKYNAENNPKPDLKGIWTKAEQTSYVKYGPDSAPAVLYIVGESNCGYCKRLHKEIKAMADAGKVQARWILIGFNDAADMKAAGVVESADQQKGLDMLYQSGSAFPGTGAGLKKVKSNHAFAESYGIGGTPFIISKKKGGDVKTTPGAVSGDELKLLIAESGR